MLLDPMGMAKSSFEPSTEIQNDLAKAIMWTYSGTEFPAPTFELGMIPAGSMYSTVNDLAKFVSVLSARGKGLHGTIVSPMTLEEMWKPQFAKPGDKGGIGLGFFVSQRHGRRAVGHNGAMYGFATELAYLPEDKIGVIVAISCDVANPVATRIADHAIELMLAAKNKKPLPAPIVETAAVNRKIATHLAGKWVTADGKSIVLTERDGRLWLWPGRGGFRVELRQLGDDLVSDDRLGVGTRIKIEKTGRLVIGTDRYSPRPLERPNAVSDKWAGLIGEYGEDHNILYIHERDGRLWALIEWVFLYPLTEESPNVFRFPDFGLYHDERLVFERTKQGRASKVTAAGIEFQRRKILGEGETFAIKPIRQLQGLLKEARASSPPQESGDFLKPDLVDLEKLDGTLKLDIRYATTNNFLSTPFYSSSRAFLQRPAAEALVRVHRVLEKDGYGLLIHDAYRPWYVTKMFWEATPEKWRNFVADPMKGSRHNRGCAVDLTLFDRATGKPVVMPGVYDEFSDRSSPDYPGGTSLQRWHRDKLRRAMESEGFSVYEAEWWHFDYKDWKRYSILNKTFEQLFN
jgi:serine beta-lactamase-like protein LACTB